MYIYIIYERERELSLSASVCHVCSSTSRMQLAWYLISILGRCYFILNYHYMIICSYIHQQHIFQAIANCIYCYILKTNPLLTSLSAKEFFKEIHCLHLFFSLPLIRLSRRHRVFQCLDSVWEFLATTHLKFLLLTLTFMLIGRKKDRLKSRDGIYLAKITSIQADGLASLYYCKSQAIEIINLNEIK